MTKSFIFSLAAALAWAGAAWAQSTTEKRATTEESTIKTETSTVTTPPNPLAEKQDQITANRNLVIEEKTVQPADHDFMPLPSANPQRHLIIEPDRGEQVGAIVTQKEVLVTEAPNAITPSTTKGPFYDASENELRARKFFRGIGNILLSPGEVPNQIFQEAYRTSPITGTVVGAGKGVWKGAKRLMIGTWEIVTFYNPGKNHYQPYVQPEVVFQEYLH